MKADDELLKYLHPSAPRDMSNFLSLFPQFHAFCQLADSNRSASGNVFSLFKLDCVVIFFFAEDSSCSWIFQ